MVKVVGEVGGEHERRKDKLGEVEASRRFLESIQI
jgi:hypothetical protein